MNIERFRDKNVGHDYLWMPGGRVHADGTAVAAAGCDLASRLEQIFETVRREAAPWRPGRLTGHRIYPDVASLARALALGHLPASPHQPVYRVRVPRRIVVFATNGNLARRAAGDDALALRRKALLYWLARHATINQWLVPGRLKMLERIGSLRETVGDLLLERLEDAAAFPSRAPGPGPATATVR